MTDLNTRTVALSGKLGIRDVAGLLARLQAAMAEPAPVIVIDCTELEAADVTTLQLLVAARHSAGELGKRISLVLAPESTLDTLLRHVGFLDPDGRPKSPHDDFWAARQNDVAA